VLGGGSPTQLLLEAKTKAPAIRGLRTVCCSLLSSEIAVLLTSAWRREMKPRLTVSLATIAFAILAFGCASRKGVWPPPEGHLRAYPLPDGASPELSRALMPVMRASKLEGDRPPQPVWVFYPPPQFIVELVGADRLAECTDQLDEGANSCWVRVSSGVEVTVFRDGDAGVGYRTELRVLPDNARTTITGCPTGFWAMHP
jgi:hypothetical protein